MSKLTKRLKISLKPVLKSFSEFLFHSILGYLLLMVGGISAILLFLWDRILEISNKNIIGLPKHLKLYHLLLLLPFLAFYFLVKRLLKKRLIKPAHYSHYTFIEIGGFDWKVNRDNGFVFDEPYCPIHKIKLLRKNIGGFAAVGYIYNYYCIDCNELIRENINGTDVLTIKEMAENKAEQLLDINKL